MLMKLKREKKKVLEFLIILILTLIICNGFLRMHYTTDTYKITDEGYINYAIKWSFKDGRPIMFMLLIICEFIKIPIEVTNFIFTLTGIIISCIATIIIKNIILGLKSTNNKKNELLVLVLSYLVIFNFMYIEAIYFLEIIIISLSILLYVIATKVIIERRKNYLINALILVILGVISYQGTISFFIAFSISMLIIKNKKFDMDIIKDFFIIMFITIISIILNIVVVKISSSYIGITQNRFNINNILNNLCYIINNFTSILLGTCGILNKYCYITYLAVILIIALIYAKIHTQEFEQHYIRIFCITIISIGSCFLVFLATLSSFDCGRMYIAIGALPSFVLIYLYVNTEMFGKKNLFLKFLYFIVILWFIINIITYILRIDEAREKNRLEKEYCNNIYNYYAENEIVLENTCIIPVNYNEDIIYFSEIETRNKMTINEIRGYQSAISGFNVNTGSKVKEIKASREIIEEYRKRIKNGEKGINGTYIMYIEDILIMPAFIW